MRTLVPAETLVYLETNDLAAALQPIVDSKPFTEVAVKKPDFSALKGVQVAVAVTGFETTEEKITDEQSIGSVQPRFVAVADTHAWNYQAVKFAELKLGSFVANIYNSEPTLEKTEKNGGSYLTWTAKDGRKAYALVIDALIYFGNDATAIDKCLAVKRGESDSIAKTGKIKPPDPTTLASGYVSTDGVAQIAALVGIKFASEAADETEVQSAIAGVLPKLIRGTITDVTWTMTKGEQGIEDKYQIGMQADDADVFNETFALGADSNINSRVNNTLLAQLPTNTQSATRYNLKDPQLAWRSSLLVAQKQLDSLEIRILAEFATLLFEPYGIRDPELFLSSLGGKFQTSRNIVTAKLDAQSDESFVIAGRGDDQTTIKALSPEFKPPTPVIEDGINIWSDGDTQVAFDGDTIKMGSKDDLPKFNGVRFGELKDIQSDLLRLLAYSKSPISTVGQDRNSALVLIEMLAREGHGDTQAVSTYVTETRFTKSGMERRTVSDFGLIGSIIAQLSSN